MHSQQLPTSLAPFQENEFLPPINRWIHFGGFFIVAAIAVLAPLSSVAKYKTTVKVPASIRPAGELRVVQANADGAVARILVQENQSVRQGDVIATLDDARLQTQKSQLQTSMQQAQLQLGQISAQLSALDHQLQAEANRTDRAIASAKAELQHQQRLLQNQQITAQAQVEEATANLRAVQASLGSAQTRRDRYRPIAEVGAISRDRLEEAELAVEQQQQEVQASEARLQNAQAALNPSQASIEIAGERIEQERAAGDATRAVLRKEREALIQQRTEAQKRMEQDQHSMQQVAADLKQMEIRASADGVLFQLNLRNTEQMVRGGDAIAQIAPTNIPPVAKALVPAKDVSKLDPGQPVQMRISACPYPDYGTLKGTVTTVSPDAVGNPAASPGAAANRSQPGAGLYEVTVELASTSIGRNEQEQCSIQLGMEGQADIVAREETIMQFFLRKSRLTLNV